MANDKILVHSDYRDDSLKLLDQAHLDYVPWLDAMHQVHRGQDAPDIPITRTGQVEALINSGRCLWVCPACNSVTPVENRPSITPVGNTGTGATWDLTPTPAHYGHPSICVQCGSDWVDVIFPTNRAAIEAELMKQPGHRGFAPVRNWQPGWTLEYLQERTARAYELIGAGVEFVRALSIGTPRLWAVGEILTASNMNTYISNILDAVGSWTNDYRPASGVEVIIFNIILEVDFPSTASTLDLANGETAKANAGLFDGTDALMLDSISVAGKTNQAIYHPQIVAGFGTPMKLPVTNSIYLRLSSSLTGGQATGNIRLWYSGIQTK